MAERIMIVCDVCGASPADQVSIKLRERNLVKDLCATHVAELVKGARTPRRGRRRGAAATSPSLPWRDRPRRTAVREAAASQSTPRKKAEATKKEGSARRTRRRITDPAVLAKRRAALAKARQTLAKKRAAAKEST